MCRRCAAGGTWDLERELGAGSWEGEGIGKMSERWL